MNAIVEDQLGSVKTRGVDGIQLLNDHITRYYIAGVESTK